MLYANWLAHVTSASIQTGFKATKSQKKVIDQALSLIGEDCKLVEYIYNNDSGVVILILKGDVELRIGKRGKIN